MLDAADEIAEMDGGIHEDEAPRAFVVFDDVDAGVVLFDLPEMGHGEAEDVAEDDFIHRVVGGGEDGLSVVFCGDVVKGGAGAAAHVFEIFAARHLHKVGPGMPEAEFFRILGGDLFGEDAFPRAVGDLREPFVGENGQTVEVSREAAGVAGAGQGARDAHVDGNVFQRFRRALSLRDAPRREGRVFLSLVAAFNVPCGLAVPDEDDAYHGGPQ